MLYSNDALSQLTEVCQSLSCSHEIVLQTEDIVKLNAFKDGREFQVWFDVSKQQYFLSLIMGGAKSCTSLEEFKSVFSVYLNICTVVIPNAKSIVDVFEEIVGYDTIYDTFTSDINAGKVGVLFKVLGHADVTICVKTIMGTNQYRVIVKEVTEDSATPKTTKEYIYTLDDTKLPVLIPNIFSYVDELYERYESSADVNISRIDVDKFNITIGDTTLTVLVEFKNGVSYKVLSLNGVALYPTIDVMCKDYLDMHCVFEAFFDFYKYAEDDEPLESVDVTDSVLFEEAETVEVQDYAPDDLVNDIIEEPDFDLKVTENEELDEKDDIFVTLVTENGENRAVRFVDGKSLFDIDVEVASSLGIPISRISTKEEFKVVRGMLVTESERNLGVFATDITGSLDLCKHLISRLLE